MNDLTPAYILHMYPFKDSSRLLLCLSYDHGMVSIVARGVRRPRSHLRALMQPFIRLYMTWMGRSDLKTLTHVEAEIISPKLTGHKILLGLYLNELLVRLLERFDPHPEVFHDYDNTLEALANSDQSDEQEFILRQFELKFLAALGYGLDLTRDVMKGEPLVPELLYSYDPAIGLFENSSHTLEGQIAVSGASILALSRGDFNKAALPEMKMLMRFVLTYYLGNKPIQSRKLFNPYKNRG